jgi:hypothetical protein
MQATVGAAQRAPLGIALDAELGSRIDAVLAVALLNGLNAQGEARRISLTLGGSSLTSARFADVLAEFYPTLPEGARATIGMPDGASRTDDAPPLATALARKAADGQPLFSSVIQGSVDTADSAVLMRNLLLAEPNASVSVVLAGRATGLLRLLGLHGARAQIAAKVRHLVMALGAFPAGPPEAGIQSDVLAARRLLQSWPTPVIAVGSEVGAALPYPAASIEQDLAWSPAHPVAHAYRAFAAMPYAAPTTALAALLQAVRPDAGYFKLSGPGIISVEDDGRTRFTQAAAGTHRYLMVDPARRDHVIGVYTALVSAMPAPRPVRGPRPAAPAAAAAAVKPA